MSGAFARSRAQRPAYPALTALEVGPWRGVRDHADPTTSEPNLLHAARNMAPEDPEIGGGHLSRPGFTAATDAALGTFGNGQVQGLTEFTQLDQSVYRVAVVDGVFYTYDWGTRIPTSHALGGGLVIDPTVPVVYLVAFADQLVLSDGVHKPIVWDGTTFTELTAAPVLFGKPWVYFDKLFGIKDAERSTTVWSEEADPTIGYEAGGFNNAWTLGQTDQHALEAGVGLNDGMVVFRGRSTTLVTGAVNDEFQSTGTRDGVSETIGTTTPAAVVVVGRDVYFLDADRRPQLLSLDGGLRGAARDESALWVDCRETIKNIPVDDTAAAIAVYLSSLELVLFGVPALGQTVPSFWLVFSARDGQFQGTWTGFQAAAVGVWTDLEGKPRMVHGGLDGWVYVHGVPNGTLVDDELVGGTQAIDHYVETGPVGYDTKVEKVFDRIDISARALTVLTNVSVNVRTPAGTSASQVVAFNGGLAIWDMALWDVSVWSTDSAEQHADLGVRTFGRYGYIQISHQVVGESFGMMKVAVEVYLLGPTPQVP